MTRLSGGSLMKATFVKTTLFTASTCVIVATMTKTSKHIMHQPLAARLRPTQLEDFVGQPHLLAKGKPLQQLYVHKILHSMILWGPPGTGKTTLAQLLAERIGARVEKMSAVLAGVKEIRSVATAAEQSQQPTVLFVDEVHRFNKAQQDAFLPYVENGVLIFIGATTENPSFALNNALLSRTRVYVLKRLQETELLQVLEHALINKEVGLGSRTINFPLELRKKLAHFADGDARQLLNMLEIIADFLPAENVTEDILDEVIAGNVRRFDKGGDLFYEQISALHKAVRGSSPDAALYWLTRMLDGGCDPLYIARRVLRMASEDIGNADPRALTLALDAWQTYERLGSPEGELALAQVVIYLAAAAKSNAVYEAYNKALIDVKEFGSLDVPLHLRNAPTGLLKKLGYGKEYRYAHTEENAYAAGATYFPSEMGEKRYYFPVARGLEIQIKEKLEKIRELDKKVK